AAWGAVVELVEPVDDLTVTVVQPARPFAGSFFALLLEDAVRPRVFKLDEAVRPPAPFPDNQVTGVNTEDVKLPRNSVGPGNPRVEHAEEYCHVGPVSEERQQVAALGQFGLVDEQSAEFVNLLTAEGAIEGNRIEPFHPTGLPARFRSRNSRRVSSRMMSNS